MTPRSWATTWLSPLALSNTALLWATAIGGLSTLLLVPGSGGPGRFTWEWLLVALVSQVVFALVLIVIRLSHPRPSPLIVFLALSLAGVLRGATIAVAAGVAGLQTLSAASVLGRSFNSAVISVIGVALIGATLTWRTDFREHYQLLRDRALLLGSADERVDPVVLEAWTQMKGSIDNNIRSANEYLAAGAGRRDLVEASILLSATVDVSLRPTTRAMWQETIPTAVPLRLRSVIVDVIDEWRLPLMEILGFLAIVVGVGSVVRSGLIDGSAYTLRYLLVTGAVLLLSMWLARQWPRATPVIATLTLVLLPPLLLIGDFVVGDVILGLPEDPTGQIIVAIQTPITVMLIAVAVGAVRDRQRVLIALQNRIDAEAVALRHSGGPDAQRLSLFVHHSVQSELAALAMQLKEAAATADPETMDAVRLSALSRLEQLASLDPQSPPWLREERGVERIERTIEAWNGILEVEVDMPDEDTCRRDQWVIAAQVVEEGLANAARHSGASRVHIIGQVDAGVLTLVLEADGATHTHRGSGMPTGIGSQWLDRVAPGNWELQAGGKGSRLEVHIQ